MYTATCRAALRHLAELRDLRRLPLTGAPASVSAPSTPSAARTSDLPASGVDAEEILSRTSSQPPFAPATAAGTDSEPIHTCLVERPGQDKSLACPSSVDGQKKGSCLAGKPGVSHEPEFALL